MSFSRLNPAATEVFIFADLGDTSPCQSSCDPPFWFLFAMPFCIVFVRRCWRFKSFLDFSSLSGKIQVIVKDVATDFRRVTTIIFHSYHQR
jgi:hypothetical protein